MPTATRAGMPSARASAVAPTSHSASRCDIESTTGSARATTCLPDTPPSRGFVELAFLHAEDINVSAPWERVSHSPGRTGFRIGPRPYDWRSRIAIGRFPVERIRLPGGDLRLAVLDCNPQPDRAAIRRWIEGLELRHERFGAPIRVEAARIEATGEGATLSGIRARPWRVLRQTSKRR